MRLIAKPSTRATLALAAALLAAAAALVNFPAPALAAAAPQVGASWSTGISSGSANLNAEINPEGLPTTYRFEYITEAQYQANLAVPLEGFAGATKAPAGAEASLGAASTVQPALQHIGPLSPATTYRYRIIASNADAPPGGVTGPEDTLTTQEATRSLALPDHRGWEMVSPIEKNSGAIQGPGQNFGGDVLQAAAQGGAITYSSASSFGEAAQGAPPASQYISRRMEGEEGWSTQNITTPTVSGSYGSESDGVPYQLFSPDLARGLLLNGLRCRGGGTGCPVANPPLPGSDAPTGYQDYYLRDDESGGFSALLTGAGIAELPLDPEQFEVSFAGASPDLRHVVLSSCAKLTPEATEVPGSEGCNATDQNIYELSEGQLPKLINLLPGETQGTPGAKLAAQSGGVSEDGSIVYFTAGGKLYVREAAKTRLVAEGGEFQTATPDGSLAFYTKAGHLERYDAATNTTEPIAAGVKGVLGVSEDGSYLYYATATGLFQSHEGTSTEVASGPVDPSNYPPTTGTSRLSTDGTHLAFLSEASLTGYDNTDANSGLPDSEVYFYVANTKELRCVSCNPTGERPLGPSTIPGAISNGKGPTAADSYKPRALVSGGRRLFFDSEDALVAQDTDNRPDVYEWEESGVGSCQTGGVCLALISGGRGSAGASFIDASETGSDVFFLTGDSLVNTDPGSTDVYDAREGGGYRVPVKPIECEGDACQPLPEAPEDPTVGTLIQGPSDPPLQFGTTAKKCKADSVRKHGRCVKKPHLKRRSQRGPHKPGARR